MAKRGGRSKLTDAMRDAIVAHIEKSLHPEVAAQCEGISTRSYFGWMARGRAAFEADEDGEGFEESEVPFFAFFTAVTRAVAMAEANTLEGVRSAIDVTGNDINGKWLLERKHPERWGNKITIELRDQATTHVIERLRQGLDSETFRRCVAVLSGTGSDDARDEEEAPLPLH